MSLPKVGVNIKANALGTPPENEDGLSGLIVTATAVDGLTLATPKQINSLTEAVDLGLTSTATPYAYRQIKGFYDGFNYITGSEVAPLWLMTLVDTVTLAQMADKDTVAGASKLLDAAQGRIKLLGLGRKPVSGYTPNLDDGIDADSLAALPKAEILGNTYAAANNPLRILVEGRAFLYANLSSLEDLRTHTEPRAGIMMGSSLNDGSADIGFVLGVAAGLSVQRNIARVKNGPLLPIEQAYIGDKKVEDFTALETVHDKGYIVYRTFPNRAGYFFNDDNMAAALTNDFSQLGRGRVIDKAHRICFRVFSEEIADDVELEEGGVLSDGVIKTLEANIQRAIETEMAGEISAFSVTIDPAQNVGSTNKLKVVCKIRPRGYLKEITIDLGFML